MLSESGLKAISLLKNGKVHVSKVTLNFIFFDVDSVEVSWDLRKDLFICLCQHESWRGSDTDKTCYHIRACKFWLEEHQDFNDWITKIGDEHNLPNVRE